MSDSARTNAEQARDRITTRLAEIDNEAKTLREQLKGVNAFLEAFDTFQGLKPNDPIPSTPVAARPASGMSPARKRPGNPPRDQVADAALKAINEAGRPMQRTELFKAVAAQGLIIEGQDPEVVFSTMLWREQDRVVRLKKLGYWDAQKAYEPAGYYP